MTAGDGSDTFGTSSTEVEAVALENVERRVLANLPPWRNPSELSEAVRLEREGHTDDQIAQLKANPGEHDEREGTDEDPRVIVGVGHSIQSYTAQQIYDRMRIDDSFPMAFAEYVIRTGKSTARPLDLGVATEMLDLLKERGFATVDEQGNWSMTELGFKSLTYDKEPVLKIDGAPDLPGAGAGPITPTAGPPAAAVPAVAPAAPPTEVPQTPAVPTPGPEVAS